LAAKAAKKKAAWQAEEDGKTEREDEGWGGNVLDAMVDQLGLMAQVEKDIRDHPPKREFAERPANFSHANEDGNPVMMTKNATRGFGASSRDANYLENVRLLLGGGRKKGFCAVPKCNHLEMELLHKCATCNQFEHDICSMENNLAGEDDCFYCSHNCHPN
jgi:hypothetical protein